MPLLEDIQGILRRALTWATQYLLGPVENMVRYLFFPLSCCSLRFQLARFGYTMEFTLRAGVRIFNTANTANEEREPLFERDFDIGTLVLPRGGRPNQGDVKGEGGQGEGGQGEGAQGEGGQGGWGEGWGDGRQGEGWGDGGQGEGGWGGQGEGGWGEGGQ
jgi:hypothetical protein